MTEVVLFLSVLAGVSVVSYLRYLGKCKRMDTLLKLAEDHGSVKPEMMLLLSNESTALGDLRRGLLGIAIGLPVLIGLIIKGEPATAVVLGGIPLLIGLGYLVVSRVAYAGSGRLAEEPHQQTQQQQ